MPEKLTVQKLRQEDIASVAEMNVRLQQDEGSRVMALNDAIERLSRWLSHDYSCSTFSLGHQVVGYILYRPTDPDTEGHSDGVYIRQFFIKPEYRSRGLGKAAFRLFQNEVIPPNTYITLEALTANRAGRGFWSALGFQEYSVRYEMPYT